jgi:hypothetical protein
MSRLLSSGPSALLKATVLTVLLCAAATAGAQPPDVSAKRASVPVLATPSTPATAPTPTTAPGADSSQNGFHDLICKPNGTEDGFDCADEATPAKIVPIPSQVVGPRPQDGPIIG